MFKSIIHLLEQNNTADAVHELRRLQDAILNDHELDLIYNSINGSTKDLITNAAFVTIQLKATEQVLELPIPEIIKEQHTEVLETLRNQLQQVQQVIANNTAITDRITNMRVVMELVSL